MVPSPNPARLVRYFADLAVGGVRDERTILEEPTGLKRNVSWKNVSGVRVCRAGMVRVLGSAKRGRVFSRSIVGEYTTVVAMRPLDFGPKSIFVQ